MFRMAVLAIGVVCTPIANGENSVGLSGAVSVTSGVFDRGEQLAGSAADVSAAAEYGLEAGASYPLSDQLKLGTYARVDTADEVAFADTITAGQIATTTDGGFAVGVALSWSK